MASGLSLNAQNPASRWLLPPLLGLIIALLLFWLMARLIAPGAGAPKLLRVTDGVQLAPPQAQPPPDQNQLADAPPPPPDAPPALSRADLPSLSAAAAPLAPLEAGPISVPLTLGGSGIGVTGSSGFAGFAGRGLGGGGGGGGNGLGLGNNFAGKPLVPLSTARPQMPEWACKQKLRGWVEVVFTVMPNGRVRDVKLVDADPRGVFEAAAVESISNWIYESSKSAREVKQRVEMNPEDCAYNWRQ